MRHPITSALRTWRGAALTVCLAAFAVSALPSAAGASSGSSAWPMFGQNLSNTASGSTTALNTTSVSSLKPKWAFTTGGDVTARAAVVNKVAYFPDWGGNLYAVNSANGSLIWKKNILNDYFGRAMPGHPTVTKVVSRTSPFVDSGSGTLYIGTQTGAYLLAIRTSDGTLRWATQLDTHALAIDTESPVVFNGVVYVGVASLEEGAAADPTYPCCSFQGSMLAVNAATGQVLWKTYTTTGTSQPADPVTQGITGDSVWGSTAVVDPQRNQVYFTTGNNYKDPTNCPASAQPGCLTPGNHVDSVLAVDMSTGHINWADRLSNGDDWNVACISADQTNCPTGAGPDYDFGSGVNLFTIQGPNGPEAIVGAGQKSGIYSAFDAATGEFKWGANVGPGSSLGGIEWGSATDGQRIYVAIANLNGYFNEAQFGGSCKTDCAGSWNALDPATGNILWHVPDPNGAVDIGPMTVANGVVYAPSMGASTASTPNMFALNAATGTVLWSYASGGSVNAGASIANDTVYWGSGYSNLPIPGFVGNNKFYAFTLGGQ